VTVPGNGTGIVSYIYIYVEMWLKRFCGMSTVLYVFTGLEIP
jgi:hypothetical protein